MEEFVLQCHLEALWTEANLFISLGSSFFICEMGLLLPPSQCFWEYWKEECPNVMHIVTSVIMGTEYFNNSYNSETLWDFIKAPIKQGHQRRGTELIPPIAQRSLNQILGNAFGFTRWRVVVLHFNHKGSKRWRSC